MLVALAARDVDKIADVAEQTGAATYACDATDPAAVRRLFAQAESRIGVPDLVVYNVGFRARGALVEIEAGNSARGADRQRLRRVPGGAGSGAADDQEGRRRDFLHRRLGERQRLSKSSPFAMGKFALRGLAQSLARELAPYGVHVAHFVIDGGILGPGRIEDPDRPNCCSIPRRSPRLICTPCASRAALGPGSSRCGRGWSRSEAVPSPRLRGPGGCPLQLRACQESTALIDGTIV